MDRSKSQVEDTMGEKIRIRREVIHGQKSWQDLRPRRVRTLIGCMGKDEIELSYYPGAVITGVRPASWLEGRWLEGTLGLIWEEDVEFLS